MCPGSSGGKTYPRVFQTQHHQQVKIDDYPALLRAGAASPGVSCAVWAPQFNKDGKVLGYIQGMATKLGQGLEERPCEEQLKTLFVCFGEKKAEGWPHCSLQLPKEER